MATVFVSFDWHHDRRYKHLLEAWDANTSFDFTFDDGTPDEIDSYNVGRIKAALTMKVQAATHTLVVVGRHANERHRNASLIGYKNWINFEVARSIDDGNRIVAVILDRSYELPEELRHANYTPVNGFTEMGIISGLGLARPAIRR
ncbi:hypothetical protein U91I_01190 [alpha proteobacterium U9-1i]|nr:hypothetical protein U91I_01190 [alpha proteobacterium U9-1i]